MALPMDGGETPARAAPPERLGAPAAPSWRDLSWAPSCPLVAALRVLLRAPGGANGGSDATGASCSTGGNCSVMGRLLRR